MDMTVRGGTRCSAAKAYLYEARKRPNLKVIEKALVTRVLFDGTRAIGVEYERAGQLHQLHAAREVILSGGPINSVQLLKLSGIGPAEELKAHTARQIFSAKRWSVHNGYWGSQDWGRQTSLKAAALSAVVPVSNIRISNIISFQWLSITTDLPWQRSMVFRPMLARCDQRAAER